MRLLVFVFASEIHNDVLNGSAQVKLTPQRFNKLSVAAVTRAHGHTDTHRRAAGIARLPAAVYDIIIYSLSIHLTVHT